MNTNEEINETKRRANFALKDPNIISKFLISTILPNTKKDTTEVWGKKLRKDAATKASAAEQIDKIKAKAIITSTAVTCVPPSVVNIRVGT